MTPARGRILVKSIETPEQLGSIILTDAARAQLTAWQMEVVEIGESAICSDDGCERRHIPFRDCRHGRRDTLQVHSPQFAWGNWILVAPRSLTETDVEGLYCCHQDDVLAVLKA